MLGSVVAAVAVAFVSAGSAEAAAVTGGSAAARGYYSAGVRSYGTVLDDAADGACVHAEVKLALAHVNDYTWNEARACGRGVAVSWDRTHRGPILSAFPSSSVQGIYLRVCRERTNLPDSCGGWEYIGR